MKEEEPIQSSIWERLTPDEALVLAEKILHKIETGELRKEVYESIVDRLIAFACGGSNNGNNFSSLPAEKNILSNNNHKQHPTNNKAAHLLGLSQLPPEQKALYRRRQAVSRSIFEANKDGRIKVKNKNRRY
jgi:hypothetical protein